MLWVIPTAFPNHESKSLNCCNASGNYVAAIGNCFYGQLTILCLLARLSLRLSVMCSCVYGHAQMHARARTCACWCMMHTWFLVLNVPVCLFSVWMALQKGIPGGGELGAEKIDVDKFCSPPSYQNFHSILRMLCAVLCTPDTGCRGGVSVCDPPPSRAMSLPLGFPGGGGVVWNLRDLCPCWGKDPSLVCHGQCMQ